MLHITLRSLVQDYERDSRRFKFGRCHFCLGGIYSSTNILYYEIKIPELQKFGIISLVLSWILQLWRLLLKYRKPTTLDDALKELLENYKKKTRTQKHKPSSNRGDLVLYCSFFGSFLSVCYHRFKIKCIFPYVLGHYD